MITCPHCQNPIHDEDALLCHFCGNSLHRPSQGLMGKLRYSRRWIFIAIAGVALLSFLLLFLR